jgi:hypothetical protein
MKMRREFLKFIIWSVISILVIYCTPNFIHAYYCRKTAITYFDNIIHQNFDEAARYVSFNKSDENRISKLEYYSDVKKKWIEVMKLYREQNTYVKSYKNLSIWPLTLKANGKISITIIENGIEKIYNTKITFGTIHGRKAIGDIGIDTRFGKALSGIDIDIF